MNTTQNRLRAGNALTSLLIGLVIAIALASFEVFNFDTTAYALRDMIGNIRFINLEWAVLLAIAACGIDFAGLAKIFYDTSTGAEENNEVWYLFGAWLLAGIFNAMFTWYAVSLRIVLNSDPAVDALIPRGSLLRVVPIAVAVFVWLVRVLVIGTIASAGRRFFTGEAVARMGARLPASTHPFAAPRTIPQPVSGAPKTVPGIQGAFLVGTHGRKPVPDLNGARFMSAPQTRR